jgi:AmiR/NasT family two-component response regulator
MSGKVLLRSLRETRILVVHPADRDGDELVRHLRRIGCQVRVAWPQPETVADEFEVVFFLVDRERPVPLAHADSGPRFALVAIVDYEDPQVLNALIDANVRGVVTKPIRPFGILSTLVMARAAQSYETRLLQKVNKLEETMRSRREIEKSVRILMSASGLSEGDAYQLIRRQAMDRRQSMASVASSIIHAHSLFRELGASAALASEQSARGNLAVRRD